MPTGHLVSEGDERTHYDTRDDGVRLSATLYLPPGYNAKKDGPLPFLFWAYPREHKSRNSQPGDDTHANLQSAESLVRDVLLTQGYGVLMSLRCRLWVRGPRAERHLSRTTGYQRTGVDALVARGVADPDRIAIGGHSYGAFTTNLLAHSDLFRAGIAAVNNRTLTPFGFQGEQRTFWQAQDVYMSMSPFTNASKINEPMLMIMGRRTAIPAPIPCKVSACMKR